MSDELRFHPDALDDWRRLDTTVREQLKKKLAERLQEAHVPAARLSGRKDRYKIKLKSLGYRLAYEVRGAELVVLVVAVGKRERNALYRRASGPSPSQAPDPSAPCPAQATQLTCTALPYESE
jgi:mRNA interferase RelE/StbE